MAKEENNGLSIASMVCGIVAVILFWFPYLGLPSGVVAIVLYLKSIKKGIKNGFATTGLITGIVGIALSIIMLLFVVLALVAIDSIVGAGGYY